MNVEINPDLTGARSSACAVIEVNPSLTDVVISEPVMIDDQDDQRIESTELPIPTTEAEIIDWSSDLAGSSANTPFVSDESEDDGFGPKLAGNDFTGSEVTDMSLSVQEGRRLNEVWSKELYHICASSSSRLNTPWERYNKATAVSMKFNELLIPKLPQYTGTVPTDVSSSKPSESLQPAVVNNSPASWWAVKQRISNVDWQDQLDNKRNLALERCRVFLQLDPSKSELGRVILADVHTLSSDSSILNSIMNVFTNKATKTILKRTASFQKFVAWCINKKIPVYPVLEANAYLYLNEMAHKSPSFASSFKESLNFMHDTLGIDGCKQAAESRRIVGICMSRSLLKKPRVQAPPLTTRQVSFMEEFVCSDADPIDRLFIGHCLLCVYTRSRWDDLQHACEPKVDFQDNDGYFELSSLVIKTSTNVAKKTTFLPMVVPLPGITDYPWLQTFLSLREELKLPQSNNKEPSMPVVLTTGKWGKMALSSSQAGEWIRLILLTGGVSRSHVRVTSHSFKATVLSWAAKGGLSKEHRCILGYHTIDTNQSMLHYSRDEQAAPLRALKKLLNMIKLGQFKPDNTRSGYFSINQRIMLPTPKSVAAPSSVVQGVASADMTETDLKVSSSDSSSSESESSNVMSEEEIVAKQVEVPARLKKRLKLDPSVVFAVHSRWRTLHVVSNPEDPKLKCGRRLTSMYRVAPEMPSFEYHKCIDCFGHTS